MKIENLNPVHTINNTSLKAFSPEKINHDWIWEDPKLNTLLAEANVRIGELNAFSLYVPNIDIFMKMHIVKEATTSSKIEGTRTEVEDALLKETDISTLKTRRLAKDAKLY